MLAGTWGKFGFYFVNVVCVFLRILIFVTFLVFYVTLDETEEIDQPGSNFAL